MASYDRETLFTYEGRLATFKKTTKKRGSAASGRGGSKALNWPHKQITPASVRVPEDLFLRLDDLLTLR